MARKKTMARKTRSAKTRSVRGAVGGNWTNERPCCVITWATLAQLGEISTPFPAAGTIKMNQLIFWAGSAATREARARRLAVQVDGTFIELFGSKYEKDVTKTMAILGLTDALLVSDNTLTDLADADDQLYLFLGETS